MMKQFIQPGRTKTHRLIQAMVDFPEQQRDPFSWATLRNLLCLLLFLVFCVYLRTLSLYSFSDDEVYLAYSNHFLRQAPWTKLYLLFLKPTNFWEFLPLRDFTYWLDFRLYGDELTGFHASNVIWYALSVVGAFCFFREITLFCCSGMEKRAAALSLAGTLLFAVHPAHVEAAAWIASRKDLVAGTLVLFSLALLGHALRRGGRRREIILSALLLFAAYFGKSPATACVLMASVLLWAGWRVSPAQNLWEKSGSLVLFWLLTGLACFIHLEVGVETGIRIENHPGVFPMIERASRILAALSGILVFPYPARFYYDVYSFGSGHWLVSAGALLSSGLALYALSRKPSLWALGLVFVFSPMVIYLQFLPFSTWSLASERFVFVSVAGLSLLFMEILRRMTQPGAVGALVLVLFLPCAWVTWTRIGEWEAPERELLAIESLYQPDFHNAIRDRILYTLLPDKHYDEARQWAKRLGRAYAVDAMMQMIEADKAYLPFRESNELQRFLDSAEGAAANAAFCGASARLRESLQKGREQIKTEPDISYNNFLNALKNAQKYRFGNEKRLCPKNQVPDDPKPIPVR